MLPKFEPLESIPATKRNFVIKFILSLLILAFFGIFIMSIYYLIIEKDLLLLIGILFFGVLCFVCGRYLFTKYPIYISWCVDEMGLHKITTGRKNETISILYKDLVNKKFDKYSDYGLFLQNYGRNDMVFEVYSQDDLKKIIRNTEILEGLIAPNFLFRNHRELLATYLLGVTTLRPDIQIDPKLFNYFFISNKTFKHSRQGQNIFYAQVFVIVVSVMAIVIYIAFNL